MLNEQARLSILHSYDILDTPAAPEFDDIVYLARQCCDTPIALVSLVAANRQWFKARLGVDRSETPLSESVCAIAIRSGRDVFVIRDLAADPLTSDNPLVAGAPHLRYYAGAVLRAPHGAALGTVCVLDTRPRPAGPHSHEAASLEALARQTMILMELHRSIGLGRNPAVHSAMQ